MANLLCIEVQESLTELVDGRLLTPDQQSAVHAHLDSCKSCRTALALERATKNAVARAASRQGTPTHTVDRIHDLIAAEARRDEQRPSGMNVERIWHFVRTQPVWSAGIAAVFLVAVLFWPGRDHETRFNESSFSFVQEAITTYDTLAHSAKTIQLKMSDENKLRAFFTENGITYGVLIPHFQNIALAGGSVSVKNGAHVAHLMYQAEGHKLCMCQMNYAEANPTNKPALTDSARLCINAGNWYWYRKADGRTVCLWKHDSTLCAAASDYSQQEIAALFTNIP